MSSQDPKKTVANVDAEDEQSLVLPGAVAASGVETRNVIELAGTHTAATDTDENDAFGGNSVKADDMQKYDTCNEKGNDSKTEKLENEPETSKKKVLELVIDIENMGNQSDETRAARKTEHALKLCESTHLSITPDLSIHSIPDRSNTSLKRKAETFDDVVNDLELTGIVGGAKDETYNDRFKEILTLFDNFTQHLKSMPRTTDSPPAKRQKTSDTHIVVMPEVHSSCIRNSNELELPSSSSSSKQPHRALSFESLELLAEKLTKVSALKNNENVVTLPKSCQTPPPYNSLTPDAFSYKSNDSDSGNTFPHMTPLPPSSGEGSSVVSFDPERCREGTHYSKDKNIQTMQPFNCNVSGDSSDFRFVKASHTPSVIEVPPTVSFLPTPVPPCERTFHMIHIEATSSPSSSVMRRAPLCERLWNVITDFCAAICICLQVNKDCIFCLGFFIAFVVSASFLTAFFYRTLSINPQLFQQRATESPASILSKDNGYYYL